MQNLSYDWDKIECGNGKELCTKRAGPLHYTGHAVRRQWCVVCSLQGQMDERPKQLLRCEVIRR